MEANQAERRLLYTVGEPGVGKSTLMNYLLRGLEVKQIGGPEHPPGTGGWHPVPHMEYRTPGGQRGRGHEYNVLKSQRGEEPWHRQQGVAVQLGCLHPSGFHGTDRLRRDVMPFLLRWIGATYGLPQSVLDHMGGFKGTSMPGEVDAFQRHPLHPLLLGEGDRLSHDTFFTLARQAGYIVTLVHLHSEDAARQRRHGRGTTQNETWVKGRRSLAANLFNLHISRGLPGYSVDASLCLEQQEALLADDPVVKTLRHAAALAEASQAV